MSYQNLATELEMNNPSLLARWVQVFHSESIEGFSKPMGRHSKMTPDKHSKDVESPKNIGSQEPHIEELKKRVHCLEIKNVFLKELRRSRREESHKTTNKSQESFTSSEDDSN